MSLPKNWEVKKLGEVCEIKGRIGYRGYTVNDLVEKGEGAITLSPSNIQNNQFNADKCTYISWFKYEESPEIMVFEGDILFVKTGSTYGKVALVKNLPEKATINPQFVVLKEIKCSNKFLYYALTTREFKEKVENIVGGSATPTLSQTNLAEQTVPFPPLPEQKRIVSILDNAFETISIAKNNAEKNLKNAREVFDSYLQSVFANPGEDWEEKKLREVCFLITKGSSPKWQGIKYVEEPGILFVTSENVGEFRLILENRKYVEEKFNEKDKKSILKKGDVLTNIVGASIGRTAIYTLDDVANINQAVCILRCNPKLISNVYLMNLLNSPFLKEFLHSNEVNNARANLSLGFFSNLSIPLPPLPEQKAIVGKLDALSAETKKLESIYQQKLDDLDELKKSILDKAFKGEL